MKITTAVASDVEEAVRCLVTAFAGDPIPGFLFRSVPDQRQQVTARFFSLLMRARIALKAPVLVARSGGSVCGAAMGYSSARPSWPAEFTEQWNALEASVPGLSDRFAVYDAIAARCMPSSPHYYLGVIGIEPRMHGQGLGRQLLQSFYDLSAADPLSSGVYLETASPSNVHFYNRAGFTETGSGPIDGDTLWGMFLPHGPR